MKADTSALPFFREMIRSFYAGEPSAPDYLREKVFAFLDTVPDAPTCIHGDLQTENLITDGKRELWIDLGLFAYGVDTPDEIAAIVKRLLPFAAVRIPFMLNMAYRKPISDGLAQFVIDNINTTVR